MLAFKRKKGEGERIKRKLLVISTESQSESQRIREEAEKRGWEVKIESPQKALTEKIEEYSHILLRAIKGQSNIAKKVAEKALKLGLKVVDEKIALGQGKNKLAHYLLFRKAIIFFSESYSKSLPLESWTASRMVLILCNSESITLSFISRRS